MHGNEEREEREGEEKVIKIRANLPGLHRLGQSATASRMQNWLLWCNFRGCCITTSMSCIVGMLERHWACYLDGQTGKIEES